MMMKSIKSDSGTNSVQISVVMPCLNEEQSIGICIKNAVKALDQTGQTWEIVIADNGSTDRSAEIAESLGARIVHEPERGYGNAFLRGISESRGKVVILGDSDNTYDFGQLELFIQPLNEGADMVIGNRFQGKIHRHAMPWLHRYIGNPVLSKILNLLFHTGAGDAHCGMRAFKREVFEKINLEASGMEFASEMIIKAARMNLEITEVPIDYFPRQKGSVSKLRSFKDGWRHLRFMLLYSPTWLFLIPGFGFLGIGLLFLLSLVWGPLQIGDFFLDFHFMALGSLLAILGVQVVMLGLYAKVYTGVHKLEPTSKLFGFLKKHFRLERGVLAGVLIFLTGLGINLYILILWLSIGFQGRLYIREVVFAMTFMIVGAQVVFSSFFISVLGIEKKGTTGHNSD